MSRISQVSNHDQGSLANFFQQAEKWMGFLPNDGLIMAHKPKIATSFFTLVKSIYDEGTIEVGLKRMIGHISSKAGGCTYCSAHTAYGAHHQGVSSQKLEAIWEFETAVCFSESERAALNIALKSSMVPNQVTDADFDRLKKYYDNEAIVEIVSIISMFGFLNRWNTTFNTQLEEAPNTFYESLNHENNE